MFAGLRIQIPPGISLKDKPHTKRKTKNVTARKSNPHQQLNTKEASCSASCCHVFCSPSQALVVETSSSET